MLKSFINRSDNSTLYRFALGLAIFTIAYNILEGTIATWVGYSDDSLTLFGFGVDSFIEVISGAGIAHMIHRIGQQPDKSRDPFERTALRITGVSFYILIAGLVTTGIYNIVTGHKPESTIWGVVIAIISICVMLMLITCKTAVGKKLNSEAMLADASCTRVCIYMSVILLASSGIYELTSFAYVDTIGSFGIAYFSFREGKECFEKAKSNKMCACD